MYTRLKIPAKYGIKAYGSWDWFRTKREYKEFLTEWMMNTCGAEQERATQALCNLEAGIPQTDTDAPEPLPTPEEVERELERVAV